MLFMILCIESSAFSAGSIPSDSDPPLPDPSAWSTMPVAINVSAVTMMATTASDPYGVEYLFEETSGNNGGSKSDWQASSTYTDTDLRPETTYTYRVRTRDISASQNVGEWSVTASVTTGESQALEGELTLDFKSQYLHSVEGISQDHLCSVVSIGDDRAIVLSNMGLALVDLNNLDSGYIYRLSGINARNACVGNNGYIYVNCHRGQGEGSNDPGHPGFSIVKIDGDSLHKVLDVQEPDVLYEKMRIDGDYLYVAAHSKGLRIYSIIDPESPVLVGTITDGFIDAFDIAVSGNTAYVADGAGGLKVVDVSNKSTPFIIEGEDIETAQGTAEAILLRDGRIYMASGASGLAVYMVGDLDSRTIYPTGSFAEDMAWVGDYLAVTNVGFVRVYEIQDGTAVALKASEKINDRYNNDELEKDVIRLAMGVGSANGNLVLVANWNWMDVYQLKNVAESTQPDINSSSKEIRFPASGGNLFVTVSNNGTVDLTISKIASTNSKFTAVISKTVLIPGESADIEVTYSGGSPIPFIEDIGKVLIYSDDPDESPMPFKVRGKTADWDPGETINNFSLPEFMYNTITGNYDMSSFTLNDHRGKVVWLQVFGSW